MSPNKNNNNHYKLGNNFENLNHNNNNNSLSRDSFSSSNSSLDSLDEKMAGGKKGASVPLESGGGATRTQFSHNYRSSWLVYLATLSAQMSSIAMGCTFGWSGPALDDMKSWPETRYKPAENSSQGDWIASVLHFGALLGAAFCGLLMDGLGRKKTLVVLGVPYVIGWLVMGFASGFWMLVVGRFVTGLALGVTTAVLPTYVAEISTPNNRGFLGMAFNFFVCTGMVFMAAVFCLEFHWYQLAFWAILPSGLLSLSMLFMPESPSWCVNRIKDSKEGVEQAIASLRRLRTPDSDIQGELNELVECANRQAATNNHRLRLLSFATYARPDVYKPLLTGMLLLFFQQFSGVNAVMFYLNDIFSRSTSLVSPKLSGLIANSFMLAATVGGGLIIDRFGRRILYAASAIGMMISIAILGVYKYQHRNDDVAAATNATNTTLAAIATTVASNLTTVSSLVTGHGGTLAISTQMAAEAATTTATQSTSVLPIVVICIFLSAFSLGVGPICWIIITEITPPQTLGLISSTSSAFAWIFAFVVVNYSGNLNTLIHEYGTYWFFAGIMAVSSVFIFVLPETKGKTLEEIIVLLKYDEAM